MLYRQFPTRHPVSWLLLGCFAAGLYLSSAAVRAVEVKDLFVTEVAVEDQSAARRDEAFRAGLGNVLVKVSGARDILTAPAVEPIMRKAARYVQRYHYFEKPLDETGGDALPKESPEAAQPYLSVDFDGEALQRDLRDAGLPVWGANRPQVLVWLGADQGPRERFIVAEDSGEDVRDLLMAAAQRRGVPLILPLMDLEDRRHVAFVDISAGFTDNLSQASERYNARVVLVGYLNKGRDGNWTVEWTVLRDNVSSRWRETDVDLRQAVDSGVDGLADILASRYASTSSGGELVNYTVAVEDVTSLDDYAAVLTYLEKLVFVEDVTPVNLKAGQVYYRVAMRGALRELEHSLALMPSLRPVAVAPEPPSSLTPLQPVSTQNQPVSPLNPAAAETAVPREQVDLRYRFVTH